ncbi:MULTISPECIES: hypothetical protein [unclassified Nitrobacter]|uniref:hypothetical protein n=1 Tax=unclassified Nitrobacter TaxID=2620411 RepID=UPI0002DAFD01|nr:MULTISPECIES: hypothetical protein [unclassified Nitrobacter]
MIGGLRDLRRGTAEYPRLWTIYRNGDQLSDEEGVMVRRATPNGTMLHSRDG